MTFRPSDTSDDVWRLLEAGLRRMTPGERIRRALELSELARGFALGQIRRRYPSEGPSDHLRRLAARTNSPALMRSAFGSPDDRGA
ncbi:MAG: hypothetical protein JNL21_12500 [Myxococcales bacterium]|nr:hypothetical protein [Myxococcales bacterium]